MDLNIRIAGEAGQGVQTTGNLLAGSLAALGLHVLASQSYLSRIRGGLNWMDVRVADTELFGAREQADLLVALTPEAREILQGEVTASGIVLYDGDEADSATGIPFTSIARTVSGSVLMANTVAAGAVYALLGYPLDALCHYLRDEFSFKGDEIVEANIRAATAGAERVKTPALQPAAPRPAGAPRAVADGAGAVALGAATAGVKLASAYPMSPSTATCAALAALADDYGIVVEQAEDEIAAVNMICGATYAGVPALTTTSGGGFALMVEGLSLAGMMELPIVILLAQRPGPATGLPTRTAQQDLRFALHAGHGEFARAIYAPGTLQQCFTITRQALATAHQYQTPVIILTDQYLQDLAKNIPPLDARAPAIDRGIMHDAPAEYRRYAVTASGVSPRAIPGGAARVVVDSDEHDESGHLTEDLTVHLAQQDKRMRKAEGMTADALPPDYYGPPGAEQVLMAWGSSYGPCREAVDLLNAAGGSYALLHFPQVWPINAAATRALLANSRKRYSVEGNATGQFAAMLREARALDDCDNILRYDGLAFTAEYIIDHLTGGNHA